MRRGFVKVLTVLVLVFASAFAITACGEEEVQPPAPQTYAVTYVKGADDATGTAPASAEKEEGAKFNLPANPFTYAGHTFTGWNDGTTTYDANAEYTMPAKAVTFTAQWQNENTSATTYTVTYAKGADDATGDIPASAEKAEGAKFNLPANPFTNSGYEFTGWNDGTTTYAANAEYTMPAKAVTFTAQWIRLHTVTVDPNNGDQVTVTEVRTGSVFAKPVRDPVHPDGKVFRYWAVNNSEYDFTQPVTSDLELTAEYAWKVTFNAGEGTGSVDPQWVKIWGSIILPDGTGLSHSSKIFDGWTDGTNNYSAGDRFSASGNVTLTAVWKTEGGSITPQTYTLSYYCGVYNQSGMTGETPASVSQNAGASVTLPACPWTRTGYTFAGWCPQEYKNVTANPYGDPEYAWVDIDSNARLQADATYIMPAMNIRLSAKWESSSITVKFNANGGTGNMSDGTFKFGNRYVLPESTFTAPTDKIFAGWAFSASGNVLTGGGISSSAYQPYVTNNTLTLYAIWDNAPVLIDVADVAGTWTGGSNSITISTAGADSVTGLAGTAIWNEKIYLYVVQYDGALVAYDYGYNEYVITYDGSDLNVCVNEGTPMTFTKTSELTTAPASDFAGKWVKSGISQNWVITQTNAYYGINLTEAKCTIIGNYLAITYESLGYYVAYVLEKDANTLVGWYDCGDAEKSEAQRVTATTFNAGTYFLVSIEGKPNQIVNSGATPVADKIVAPAAPSGQTLDKWVYVNDETTEFVVTAAMTADADIKPIYKDQGSDVPANVVVFTGSCTTPTQAFLGGETYIQFKLDFASSKITYMLLDGTEKTVALYNAQYPNYKPGDLGSDASYYDVQMEGVSYHILLSADQTRLILCDDDDTVLSGGTFIAQTGDWVSLSVVEGSEFYTLAEANTDFWFEEGFEVSGTTFTGIQFTKNSTGAVLKTYYMSNGVERLLSTTIGAPTNEGAFVTFTSNSYTITLGKKSDGKYYVTSFQYKTQTDTTERVLLTEKP